MLQDFLLTAGHAVRTVGKTSWYYWWDRSESQHTQQCLHGS